jgi:hypothetical protein
VVVPRGSAEWEFRHDLMRAYLAARYASTSNVSLALADERIWRLNDADQSMLFHFLVKLLRDDQLETAYSVGNEEPDTRRLLLASLRMAPRPGATTTRLP